MSPSLPRGGPVGHDSIRWGNDSLGEPASIVPGRDGLSSSIGGECPIRGGSHRPRKLQTTPTWCSSRAATWSAKTRDAVVTGNAPTVVSVTFKVSPEEFDHQAGPGHAGYSQEPTSPPTWRPSIRWWRSATGSAGACREPSSLIRGSSRGPNGGNDVFTTGNRRTRCQNACSPRSRQGAYDLQR